MFIEIGGRLINTSQVLWIEPASSDRGEPRSIIRYANGDTLTVKAGTDWLARQRDEIVPAPTGYQAVRVTTPEPSDPDQSIAYELLPVLAFRVRSGSGNQPEPVTPDGILDDEFAIVGPDGRCWDYGEEHESIEAFKKRFDARWAHINAYEAKKSGASS